LVNAIEVVLPTISHKRRSSGICSDDCEGCHKHRNVMKMLVALENDIKRFGAKVPKRT